MSRRFTAIVLCFSLVGLTVLPATYLPCCCKTVVKVMPNKNASCCAMHKPAAAVAGHMRVASCCASAPDMSSSPHHPMNQQSCCTGKTLKKTCPICRCLEQMQIVALAGSPVSETVMRVAAEAVPLTAMPMTDVAFITGDVDPQRGSPGIVITLQTCSLRC